MPSSILFCAGSSAGLYDEYTVVAGGDIRCWHGRDKEEGQVIPELRISDLGLIDVTRFEKTPLFVDARDGVRNPG